MPQISSNSDSSVRACVEAFSFLEDAIRSLHEQIESLETDLAFVLTEGPDTASGESSQEGISPLHRALLTTANRVQRLSNRIASLRDRLTI